MQDIPKLKDIYNNVIADIEGEFNFQIPPFLKNVFRAFAAVQAGSMKLNYLAIAKVQRNVLPDYAEPVASGGTLERHGRIKLNRGPFPAIPSKYEVDVIGTVGATVPAGTVFIADDDSLSPEKRWVLDQDFTLQTSPDTMELRALEAGLDSQLQNGDTLTSSTPITNVDDQVVVTNESQEPKSAETFEQYRQVVIDAYRYSPQGGAATDYRLWTFDAQGVRTSYPFTVAGTPNKVVIYVEANPSDSVNGNGEPTTTILQEAEDVIRLDPDTTLPLHERGRKPLTDEIDVQPVDPIPVDIEVQSFQDYDSSLGSQLKTVFDDYIFEVRPFVSGIDQLTDRKDRFSENVIIYLIQTVKSPALFGAVTLTVNGSQVSSYQFTDGEAPYLNSLTINGSTV